MSTPSPVFSVTRSADGALRAESALPLGFDRRELRITTSKSGLSRLIVTRAMCVQVSECGRLYTYAIGGGAAGDYSATLARADGRATARAIEAQHAAALQHAAAHLEAARAHYRARIAAPAGA